MCLKGTNLPCAPHCTGIAMILTVSTIHHNYHHHHRHCHTQWFEKPDATTTNQNQRQVGAPAIEVHKYHHQKYHWPLYHFTIGGCQTNAFNENPNLLCPEDRFLWWPSSVDHNVHDNIHHVHDNVLVHYGEEVGDDEGCPHENRLVHVPPGARSTPTAHLSCPTTRSQRQSVFLDLCSCLPFEQTSDLVNVWFSQEGREDSLSICKVMVMVMVMVMMEMVVNVLFRIPATSVDMSGTLMMWSFALLFGVSLPFLWLVLICLISDHHMSNWITNVPNHRISIRMFVSWQWDVCSKQS